MEITMKKEIAEDRISRSFGFEVKNFASYHNGFSFTTESEINAYKAAYKYQGGHNRLVVKFAPNVNAWLVQLHIEKAVA